MGGKVLAGELGRKSDPHGFLESSSLLPFSSVESKERREVDVPVTDRASGKLVSKFKDFKLFFAIYPTPFSFLFRYHSGLNNLHFPGHIWDIFPSVYFFIRSTHFLIE